MNSIPLIKLSGIEKTFYQGDLETKIQQTPD